MTPIGETVLSVLGHFLWQGALIAGGVWLALRRLTVAEDRYQVLIGGLLAMLAAPVVSALFLVLTPPAHYLDPSVQGATDATLFQTLLRLWCAGVVLCLARYPLSLLKIQRLLGPAAGQASGELVARVRRVAAALGFTRPIRVLVSPDELGPATFGILRHVLILPASMVTRLSPEQLEAVLAHEIAHMIRHDFLVNLVQCVTESLLFFHPAVWWISAQIRQERENCCDDIAVRYSGSSTVYARALLNLAQGAQPQLLLAADGGDLLLRVRRLRKQSAGRQGSSLRTSALAAGLTFLLAVGGATIFSQPRPAPSTWTFTSRYLPTDLAPGVGQFDVLLDGPPVWTKKLAQPLPEDKTIHFVRIVRLTGGEVDVAQTGKTIMLQSNVVYSTSPSYASVTVRSFASSQSR